MSNLRGQRIQANCKIIWGSQNDYDIDIETDDYLNYACYVKADYGLSFGPFLTATSLCPSSEAAWARLDRMLEVWATQVQSSAQRQRLAKDESLEVCGGGDRGRGQQKNVVNTFMDALEKRKGEGEGEGEGGGAKEPA